MQTAHPDRSNFLARHVHTPVSKKATSRTADGKMPVNQRGYRVGFKNYLGRIIVFNNTRSFCQNRLFGLVRLSCQFLRVPMLTPSFSTNAPLESPVFIEYFVRNSVSVWGLFWKGCESPLTALITRWQKGCRSHPFRHASSYNYEME